MKKCPWCAEEIQDEARVCRYCNRDLSSGSLGGPATVAGTPAPLPKKKGNRGVGCVLFLVAVIVLIAIAASQSGTQVGSTNPTTPTATPNKAGAKALDPRQLVADPAAYRGQNIYLQGKALNVDQRGDYTWVQLLAQVPGKTSSSTESIVVEFRPKATGFLKDECYRVYGVANGTQEVTRTLTGAKNTVPLVVGYAFESAQAGQFNIGCAAP